MYAHIHNIIIGNIQYYIAVLNNHARYEHFSTWSMPEKALVYVMTAIGSISDILYMSLKL